LLFSFHQTLYICSEVCGTKVTACIPAEVVINYVYLYLSYVHRLSMNVPSMMRGIPTQVSLV
jgi:hypothetical protein